MKIGAEFGLATAAPGREDVSGRPEDIAELVMFLCSEKAGFITGENICVDGGMTRLMIYHGEHGWTYE
jgi:NAD(P)-dependent dehydrogenase (short-subunit alcohol dehydrogenase family)